MLFPHRRRMIVNDVLSLFYDQTDINDQMSSRPADAIIIQGYATRWGVKDLQGERIKRGAFSKSLHLSQGGRGIFMLRQHDERTWPIGKWTTVREDDVGLWCRGSLYPKFNKPDFLNDVASRKVRELSVGYYPTAVNRTLLSKTITDAWLTEISVGQNAVLSGSTFSIVNG